MISVVLACSTSRQSMIDVTMPLLLAQKDLKDPFEIIIACDNQLKLPEDYRIGRIPITMKDGVFCLPSSMNDGINAASGDIILLTLADMAFRNPFQLANMLASLKDNAFVTERFCHSDGTVDLGLYAQCLMIRKEDLKSVGCFNTDYDGLPGEDGELVTSLLEKGLEMIRQRSPNDGVHHLYHKRTDWTTTENVAKIRKSKDIFYRHRTPKAVGALYAHVMKIKETNK